MLVDERGLPLVDQISGSQVHDSRFLIPLVESQPPHIRGPGRHRGRPSDRPPGRASLADSLGTAQELPVPVLP